MTFARARTAVEELWAPMAAKPHLSRRTWFALVGTLLCAVLFNCYFRIGVVRGESMLPTFRPGEWFLISKRAYEAEEPARGDVVVARDGGELVIKRIVGLPGEEVEVRSGRLLINGHQVPEPGRGSLNCLNIAPGKLRSGKFALLGDNRTVPPGQLVHAVVAREQLVGKVLCRLAPTYSR